MTVLLRPKQIHPTGAAKLSSDEVSASRRIQVVQGVGHYITRLSRMWLALQLSHHGGEYSVERLIALDEYTQRTSLFRVVLVCLGTPLPMVLITVLQETVPLQAPSEGWRYNYGFWFRYALMAAVLTHAIGVHGTYMIGGVTLSTAQLLAFDLAVSVSLVLMGIALSALWTFPIPFVQITLNMVFVTTVILSFRGIVGRAAFQRMLLRRQQLFRYLSFLTIQVLMTVVYPSYQVLFDLASTNESELAVFLLLPVIKVMMKNILKVAVSSMEDMIPETVIFTIDFFNALYVATCMQRATSSATVAIVMAIDLLQTAFALIRLQRHSCQILAELHRTLGSTNTIDSFLIGVRALYQNPRKLKRQVRGGIRVYSCMPTQLSTRGTGLLNDLCISLKNKDDRHVLATPTRTSILQFLKQVPICQESQANAIDPSIESMKSTIPNARAVTPGDALVTPRFASERILHSSLEVLFTSECLLLTEYLEAAIPLLYGSYMLMMVWLPNAKYHTELKGISTENVNPTVHMVFIYAFLEFLSFGALVTILRCNCRLKALYQLAFVLETHMPLVQTKLISWVLITLSYRVVHFGVDFTFKFNWIQ